MKDAPPQNITGAVDATKSPDCLRILLPLSTYASLIAITGQQNTVSFVHAPSWFPRLGNAIQQSVKLRV